MHLYALTTTGEEWNLSFSRPFNDWELGDAERLLSTLGQYVVHLDLEDGVKWNLTGGEAFLVRSLYCALQQS